MRVAWFNARSLLACSSRARTAKAGLLGRVAKDSDVVFACEVLGNPERMNRQSCVTCTGTSFCMPDIARILLLAACLLWLGGMPLLMRFRTPSAP